MTLQIWDILCPIIFLQKHVSTNLYESLESEPRVHVSLKVLAFLRVDSIGDRKLTIVNYTAVTLRQLLLIIFPDCNPVK